jgi:transposase
VWIGHQHRGGAAVGYFAGLDVSLEETAICIVDDAGRIVRESRAASEPEALVAFFKTCGMKMERVVAMSTNFGPSVLMNSGPPSGR